jgi:hypothetical protein
MTRWASVRCVKSRRVATNGASGRSAGPRWQHYRPTPEQAQGRAGRAIVRVVVEVPSHGSAAKPRRAARSRGRRVGALRLRRQDLPLHWCRTSEWSPL